MEYWRHTRARDHSTFRVVRWAGKPNDPEYFDTETNRWTPDLDTWLELMYDRGRYKPIAESEVPAAIDDVRAFMATRNPAA